jgi:uncharacterized peroxidase-related enzyme
MSSTEMQQKLMFLPGVEQNPKPSTYLELIEAARASGTEYWQIWHLLAFQPKAALNLVAFSQVVMHDPAPITAGLRELIAAYTSSLNQCEFCMKAHAAVAAHIYQDDEFVASVLRDPQTSSLSENEKVLLRFVRKVTFASADINPADTERLRAAGWDDDAIFYAITTCALFNFYNRWVSASGVPLVSDEAFRRLAAPMAERGYLRK